MLGPEAELLVQPDVLRAVREREQCRLPQLPPVEQIDDRLHQPARDPTIPKIDAHGEWADEAEAAPAGREVGTDDLTFELGGERPTSAPRPSSASSNARSPSTPITTSARSD